MTRMVMMKMISSTNITSTSGVTLMSDIAVPSSSGPPTCKAMVCRLFLASDRGRGGLHARRRRLVHAKTHLDAGDQVGMQLVRKMADPFLHRLIAAQ